MPSLAGRSAWLRRVWTTPGPRAAYDSSNGSVGQYTSLGCVVGMSKLSSEDYSRDVGLDPANFRMARNPGPSSKPALLRGSIRARNAPMNSVSTLSLRTSGVHARSSS